MPISANIFDDINSTYYTNVSSIKYDGLEYKPDINVQKIGFVTAWVDIVGFRYMVYNNGKYYINNTFIDDLIVMYEIKSVRIKGGIIDYVIPSIMTTCENETCTANLNVKVKWHEHICPSDYCYNVYYVESVDFYDIEKLPRTYPHVNETVLVVHEYKDKKVIYQDSNNNNLLIGIEVNTSNGSYSMYKLGRINYTEKNVPFLNFTNALTIKNVSGMINNYNDVIILENTSFSEISYTPYTSINNTNVTIIKHKPPSIQPFIVYFVFSVGVIFFGIRRMINLCRNQF